MAAMKLTYEQRGQLEFRLDELRRQMELGRVSFDEAMKRVQEWIDDGLVVVPEPILTFLSTITIPSTTSQFVAKDKFVVNMSDDAPVKISHLGGNFTTWFLNGSGKTEDPISGQTLRYAELCKASVDAPIIAELGGEAKSETTLAELFFLVEKQKCGEDGVLLNNGWANIFYVRDQDGLLRAVRVGWLVVGWYLYADALEVPRGWRDGNQVFSRN